MKALVIGFGSIGRRHAEILSSSGLADQVTIVSRQKIKEFEVFRSLEEITDLKQYDYFVIASETHLHHEHLSFLEQRVIGKTVLVEKPLFEKDKSFPGLKNRVFVGYNLRYHPVIQKLRSLVGDRKVQSVQVTFGQYLPTWRPGTDYRKCYSADGNRGGGVLLDISHELDYVQWLFGEITEFCAVNEKISNLETSADDTLMLIGKTISGVVLNINLDCLSRQPYRKCTVQLEDATIIADLQNNQVTQAFDDCVQQKEAVEMLDRNGTYLRLHQSLLKQGGVDTCGFEEAKIILTLIDRIKKESNTNLWQV